MSGSKDKRTRKEQKDQGLDLRGMKEKQEEKANKRNKVYAIVFGIAFVILAAAVLFLNSGIFSRMVTAVEVNGHSYSVVEYDYYYYSAYLYEMNSGYGSYMIDSKKTLANQSYYGDSSITWDQYFKNTALTNIEGIQMLLDEAEANEMTELNEEYQEQYDSSLESLETAAKEAGYSLSKYLKLQYGKGMTHNIFKQLLFNGYLATQYSESIQDGYTDSYSDTELEEYYVEHADEYDKFSFRYYLVAAETDDSTTSDDTSTSDDASTSNI